MFFHVGSGHFGPVGTDDFYEPLAVEFVEYVTETLSRPHPAVFPRDPSGPAAGSLDRLRGHAEPVRHTHALHASRGRRRPLRPRSSGPGATTHVALRAIQFDTVVAGIEPSVVLAALPLSQRQR